MYQGLYFTDFVILKEILHLKISIHIKFFLNKLLNSYSSVFL